MGFWVFFSDDRVEYYDSDACALYLSPDRTIEIVDNSKIIFDFMIEHRNVAIYRDQIIAQIDGTGDSQSYNNKRADRGPVDQAIRVLRVKLDKYADCIRIVRGVGYKYVGPPKEDKQLPTSQPNTSNPPPFDAESGVKKEAERNTQIASHSSQHGAMNGSPHTSNGTKEETVLGIYADFNKALRELDENYRKKVKIRTQDLVEDTKVQVPDDMERLLDLIE